MPARRRWCGSACRSSGSRASRTPRWPATPTSSRCRRRCPTAPRWRCSPGLIRPYKGLADLLDAWPAVRRRVPGAILHVLGRSLGGDADARARRAAEGVVADLRYAEPGEWAGAMLRADVVVLPYRSIDQSGVLATAIALGRPVIATDVGGLRRDAGRHRRRAARAAARSGGAGRDHLGAAAATTSCGRAWRRTRPRPPRASCRGTGRPSATRSCTARSRREFSRREGLAVFAAGYLVHAALALVMRVPIVMYDEYGYFATARQPGRRGAGDAPALLPGLRVRADPGVPRHARRPTRAYHVSLLVHQRPARRAHDAARLAARAGAGAGSVARVRLLVDLRRSPPTRRGCCTPT